MEPTGSSVRVNLWLILTNVVLIMSIKINFVCFPNGDANWNLLHNFNRINVRLLLYFYVHLLCTLLLRHVVLYNFQLIMQTCWAHLSIMMAQISLVGVRMCLVFSRFLTLIMHFVRTNLLLPLLKLRILPRKWRSTPPI